MAREYTLTRGYPLPLGTFFTPDGVRFSIFSRHAKSVTLVLFSGPGPDSEHTEIVLDPVKNKTGDIWHIAVRDLHEGQLYGYRIDGPYEPDFGHRYNRNKLLVDPYARAVTGDFIWDITRSRGYDPDHPDFDRSFSEIDSLPFTPRCVVINNSVERHSLNLNIPPRDSIIYELHVRGFTMHPESGVAHPGTYLGLTEKIPYLKELGVTAVELMPVQEFDHMDNVNVNPRTGEKLKNYWGYNTMAFFAPKGSYAASGSTGEQVSEFREMVKTFHRAGIEVILDVVFNHTCEGDETGPTVSFRGIENSVYYILEDDRRLYKNFSGCGNTFNCNHSFVREFILDALRYWVVEMDIDGFRFDLASILGRDQKGAILANPPLIERIHEDPILRNAKIIAEAWDAAGAYQLGEFPGRWAEWNGKFRDDVRRFWRGDTGAAGHFATRIAGSSDLYYHSESGPLQSINFITCHDGFTLNDLVSYNEKHNEENGEENRDGENYNLSWNMGEEGPASSPRIEKNRVRQIKNFLATLFLSQGVPMLCAGDEFRRTQRGNNNTYCQDNELSWIDWSLIERHREVFRFAKEIIRFRMQHPVLRRGEFLTGETAPGKGVPDVAWHGYRANMPDWSEKSRGIALCLSGEYANRITGGPDTDIYMIFNAERSNRIFQLPGSPSGRPWRLAVDTAAESPADIFENGSEKPVTRGFFMARALSTAVLIA